MIIKSMSRKSASFAQLIDYINSEKADERFNVYHNVYSRDFEQLKREFEANAERLARRKNGVFLYHEILSITRAKGISEQRQKEIFCQLAQDYAQGRAGQNMVYAGMHDDKHHNLHYHFVISANGVNEAKRLRLSKAEFATFKQDFEKMVLQKYPELEQKVIIQRQSSEKLSKKGGELKRRTGKTPKRDKVVEMLNAIFEASFTHNDMIRRLDTAGYDFYIRGKNPGVEERETGRKYRLKTLGLIDQLEALDDETSQSRVKPTPENRAAVEKEKTHSSAKQDKGTDKTIHQQSDDVVFKADKTSELKQANSDALISQRKEQIRKQRQQQKNDELDDSDKQKR